MHYSKSQVIYVVVAEWGKAGGVRKKNTIKMSFRQSKPKHDEGASETNTICKNHDTHEVHKSWIASGSFDSVKIIVVLII